MLHAHRIGTGLATALVVMMLGACQDAQMPTEADAGLTPDAPLMDMHGNGLLDPLTATGSTVENITAQLITDEEIAAGTFTGRITNLRLTDIVEGDDGTLQALASGRLIGRLNGERVNQTFTDIPLGILNEDGEGLLPIDLNGNGVCPILFLELGPIFLDVLGLIVEVPDPIVLEIRAERGPGQLLGNLLCALLGILD